MQTRFGVPCAKIQTASNKGTVADLRQANKSIEYDTSQRGLVFKSGILDWQTPTRRRKCSTEEHRSQGARMVFLA